MNKIGLIARADNTGLGIQTHEFYNHIQPHKTLVVDVSELNGLPTFPYRYPNCQTITHKMPQGAINTFLDGLNVIFCCETPYSYDLFRMARNRGIKIILQYNYEFLNMKRVTDIYYPDVFASPSAWHIEEVKREFANVLYLPVPVNRELLAFTEKKKFKRFLHIAGNAATHDRNGTAATMGAFASLNDPDIELVVKCFNQTAIRSLPQIKAKNIYIDTHSTTNYEHNYTGFDALILPRKYGGLCLPMQEALSCGMPVIMTDASPNDSVLPKEWLVPVKSKFEFESSYIIEVNEPDVDALAHKIKLLADMDEATAIENSQMADKIANDLDWKIWKEKYIDFLNG